MWHIWCTHKELISPEERQISWHIDFKALFSQLSKMKDISKNLSETERKAYAEKVAVAFYKSMGGSDSEEAEG